MVINFVDRSWNGGVPSHEKDTFGPIPGGLITGDTPVEVVQDLPVALSQTLVQYQVVGLDGDGHLVPATTSVKAIGVLLYPVTTEASGDLPGGRVIRSGCINPDHLVWDASFNTDALKMNAFEDSPTPTNIILRRSSYDTVVAP